jgi:ribosomal-protein-alanine N-acetyltransferase
MEAMPYRDRIDQLPGGQSMPQAVQGPGTPSALVTSDWRRALPSMARGSVTIRELRASDAMSLFAMLTTQEVARFISPPPTTVEGFERFIAWTHQKRAAGEYVCFGVVPEGCESAIGVIQVRSRDPRWDIAEWGFAIGSEYWGTGVFADSAKLAVDFVFATLGVRRLEARAAVKNGRGNGALKKLGALQEAVLRRSLLRRGEYLDQILWTILPSYATDDGAPEVH